jgi:RNA methyltransferase, TrmH family
MLIKPLTKSIEKILSSLKLKKFRKDEGLFLVEGQKIAKELLLSDWRVKYLILNDDLNEDLLSLVNDFKNKGADVYFTNDKIFNKLSDTEAPQEILAVIEIIDQKFDYNSNFIALDGVADPGNVGTIIRTADWFGFRNIILGNHCAELYNPKTIRSTMGSFLRVNTIEVDDLSEYLKSLSGDFEIYCSELNTKNLLEECNPTKKIGIIFGNESHGISSNVQQVSNFSFKIAGKSAESLNVAVSAGIAMNWFTKYSK